MRIRVTLGVVVAFAAFLLLPQTGFSQCTGTSVVANITPDGSPYVRTIPGGVGNGVTYATILRANRSYTAKVTTPELWMTASEPTLDIVDSGCNSIGTQANTAGVQPDVVFDFANSFQGGSRVSFTVPTDGLYGIVFVNTDAGAHSFTAILAETTLFSPLWSTFGGFETFYRFQNTTNAPCTVTLRMINDGGTEVVNTAIPLMPNSTAPTRNTGSTDLNLANDQAGQAIITHNCPPGAIQVDGFLGFFGAQTNVLPIRIQTAREHAN